VNYDYKQKCFKVKEEENENEEDEEVEEDDIARKIMRDKMNGKLKMNEQISERDECEDNADSLENRSQNDLSID
jgi:hypothetical protein